MFCTVCGKENEDLNKYCFNCGKAVGEFHNGTDEQPANSKDPESTNRNNKNSFSRTVIVIKGVNQFNIKKWEFSNDLCSIEKSGTLLHHSYKLPINEIISLTKLKKIGKLDQVELLLSDDTTITLKMDPTAFNEFNKKFHMHGNQPQFKKLPLEVKSQDTKTYRIAAILLFLLLIIVMNSDEGKASSFYSLNDKKRLCRAYIASVFHKPFAHVMSYDGSGDNVYVQYMRNSDSTRWRYVCNVTNKEITWAGWQSDLNDWGRWRYEDLGIISYREGEKLAIITGKNLSVTKVYLLDKVNYD